MAWKTFRRRRRAFRSKRRRFSRRRFSRRRFRGRARRVSRRLFSKGVFAGEIDYLRNTYTGTVLPYDPTVLPFATLTALPEGDDIGDRVGRKVFVRHINLRLGLWNSGAAAVNYYTVHFLIVRDKQPPSSLTSAVGYPSIGQAVSHALGAPPANAAEALAAGMWFKQVYTYNQNRLQFLKYKSFVLPYGVDSGKNPQYWKKRLKIMKPCYFSAAGNSNNLGPGQIYCYMWSSQYTGQTPAPSFYFTARTSYTDV